MGLNWNMHYVSSLRNIKTLWTRGDRKKLETARGQGPNHRYVERHFQNHQMSRDTGDDWDSGGKKRASLSMQHRDKES